MGGGLLKITHASQQVMEDLAESRKDTLGGGSSSETGAPGKQNPVSKVSMPAGCMNGGHVNLTLDDLRLREKWRLELQHSVICAQFKKMQDRWGKGLRHGHKAQRCDI